MRKIIVCHVLLPSRWGRWCGGECRGPAGGGGGSGADGGPGVQGEVFEQPGSSSHQTGAAGPGPAGQSGRPDPESTQRQSSLQGRKGEGAGPGQGSTGVSS